MSAIVVMGEAPESEEEIDHHEPSPTISTTNTTTNPTNPMYDSLLHHKLRETNEIFRDKLIKLSCQPYLNATKEINSLSQQLIKSQKMVQQVSGTLTKLTKDLKNVEITLDSYGLDSSSSSSPSSAIPPFTNKLLQSSTLLPSSSASSPRRQPDD
ncbi:uncharacterized protein LOC128387671 [Panonychus citri]|uniref:uncharacterized protein LOC128387671 n=1 Tax=Panonychus citri TaxID=50023 RepID=UPI0023080C5F|nr:uncharacterized protein LOC128387671 [Panonychus citri]